MGSFKNNRSKAQLASHAKRRGESGGSDREDRDEEEEEPQPGQGAPLRTPAVPLHHDQR